jgi:hypothetical protein
MTASATMTYHALVAVYKTIVNLAKILPAQWALLKVLTTVCTEGFIASSTNFEMRRAFRSPAVLLQATFALANIPTRQTKISPAYRAC